MAAEMMTPKTRMKNFKEHYAHGGRDAPEACGRGMERDGKSAKRDMTHSKD